MLTNICIFEIENSFWQSEAQICLKNVFIVVTYLICLRSNAMFFFTYYLFLFPIQKTSKLDRETGLLTVKYGVKRHILVINGAPVTMLEVKLNCDYGKTPWCLKAEDHHLLAPTPAPPNVQVPNIPRDKPK